MINIWCFINNTLKNSSTGVRLDFITLIIEMFISLIIGLATILITNHDTNRQSIKSRKSIFINNSYLEFIKDMRFCFIQLNKVELAVYEIRLLSQNDVKKGRQTINKSKNGPVFINTSFINGKRKYYLNCLKIISGSMNKIHAYYIFMNIHKRDYKSLLHLNNKLEDKYLKIFSIVNKIPDLHRAKRGVKTPIGYIRHANKNRMKVLLELMDKMHEYSIDMSNNIKLFIKIF